MDSFYLNGILWKIHIVNYRDPMLIDRTGKLTVATTDPVDHIVYLSDILKGEFLIRVLLHELGHCTMVSFDLLDEIHKVVYPEYWIEAEEWICNFIADYGMLIFNTAYKSIGYKAWTYVPHAIEKFVA